MVEVDKDGWPVGEKRYNCDRCPNSKNGKPDGVNCKRKKRVGIGFCRDFPKDSATNGNNNIKEEKEQ